MDILVYFLLVWTVIIIARWWVWRRRMRRVNDALAGVSARLAAIEQEFKQLRSAQPNVERETGASPAPAAPATEREIGKPVQRPLPQDAPVSATPRGAPAPAKWSWQPSEDRLPAKSQIP